MAILSPEDRNRHIDKRSLEVYDYRDFMIKSAAYVVGAAILLTSAYFSLKKACDYFYPNKPQIQEIGTDLEDKVKDSLI